jgi:hypothetical protein
MTKLVSTTVAALATLSLAAIVCAADLPNSSDSSGATESATVTDKQAQTGVQTDKRVNYHGPRSRWITAADEVTAPLNPPAAPREMMVTPARAAVK